MVLGVLGIEKFEDLGESVGQNDVELGDGVTVTDVQHPVHGRQQAALEQHIVSCTLYVVVYSLLHVRKKEKLFFSSLCILKRVCLTMSII